MPTYSFTCTSPSCGNTVDRVLTLREFETPQTCSCGAPMERVWTGQAPGVAFKGSGWTPKHYGKKR